MTKRINVVLSQGQSTSPVKRRLEEEIVAGLLMQSGIEVTVVPHLYDLRPDGTGILALQGITGDMIVLSWLYERAARWILNRHGIRGQVGRTLLGRSEEEGPQPEDEQPTGRERKEPAAEIGQLPRRKIYCLDLRTADLPQPYIDEIQRIARASHVPLVSLTGGPDRSSHREHPDAFAHPGDEVGSGNGEEISKGRQPSPEAPADGASLSPAARQPRRIVELAGRRWYPVIDYSRCTNCMECIDFCLFGVYGIDAQEKILVEQPDNCRKGCPACSRVCPENAIMFPEHKTPAIAGAPEGSAGRKIDLSQLFGALTEGRSALDVAVQERDQQLVLAGREPAGTSVGIPKRQQGKPREPKDELDALIDQLDELDL